MDLFSEKHCWNLYIYIHIYIWTYTHTQRPLSVHTHTHAHAHTHTHTRTKNVFCCFWEVKSIVGRKRYEWLPNMWSLLESFLLFLLCPLPLYFQKWTLLFVPSLVEIIFLLSCECFPDLSWLHRCVCMVSSFLTIFMLMTLEFTLTWWGLGVWRFGVFFSLLLFTR